MYSTKPTISVIVPIYNVASLLPQCIESILNQTFSDFELILVNDGSPDESHQICIDYQKTDQRIVIVNKKNGGLLSARKAGLKEAIGEYIAFVDGDDWVDKDFLQAMYHLMIINEVDLVITGHIREFEGKCETISPYNKAGVYVGESLDKIVEKMIYSGTFCRHGISTYVWNKLFRKSLLDNVLFEVPNEIVMGEDAAITYSYISLSKSLVVSSGCYYYYRQRPNSIVKTIQSLDSELQQLSKLFHFLYRSLSCRYNQTKLRHDLCFYLYSQILVRTGGFFEAGVFGKKLVPFTGIKSNDKTLVYSSGSFGQRLVKFNEHQQNFSMIKWIDLDYEESRKIGLAVDPMYSAKEADVDSIIIASIDESYLQWIIEEFRLFGVDVKKVKHINKDLNFIESYLTVLGFTKEFRIKIEKK